MECIRILSRFLGISEINLREIFEVTIKQLLISKFHRKLKGIFELSKTQFELIKINLNSYGN